MKSLEDKYKEALVHARIKACQLKQNVYIQKFNNNYRVLTEVQVKGNPYENKVIYSPKNKTKASPKGLEDAKDKLKEVEKTYKAKKGESKKVQSTQNNKDS